LIHKKTPLLSIKKIEVGGQFLGAKESKESSDVSKNEAGGSIVIMKEIASIPDNGGRA
jgi:hypothetical protein